MAPTCIATGDPPDARRQHGRTSAWDWGEQRVTVGRHFVRDLEGLWSEVLKLAAVVEDALNQSIHALCDGRIELADKIKLQKPAVDRWEIQIERVRAGAGLAPTRGIGPEARGRRTQD